MTGVRTASGSDRVLLALKRLQERLEKFTADNREVLRVLHRLLALTFHKLLIIRSHNTGEAGL
jgi:hypothetical protein